MIVAHILPTINFINKSYIPGGAVRLKNSYIPQGYIYNSNSFNIITMRNYFRFYNCLIGDLQWAKRSRDLDKFQNRPHIYIPVYIIYWI